MSILIPMLATVLLAKSPTLIELKQHLVEAQQDFQESQEKVISLRQEIALKEITQIEKDIQQMQEKARKKNHRFQEEYLAVLAEQRQLLNEIMHTTPACAERAQRVQDRILVFITDLSDRKEG